MPNSVFRGPVSVFTKLFFKITLGIITMKCAALSNNIGSFSLSTSHKFSMFLSH